MGHYDTCREGYCGRCGQAEDKNGNCLSQWCRENNFKVNLPSLSFEVPTLSFEIEPMQIEFMQIKPVSRQRKYQKRNYKMNKCILCPEPKVNKTHCEKHRIIHNQWYQKSKEKKKMNNVVAKLPKENEMSDNANVLYLITRILELEKRVENLEVNKTSVKPAKQKKPITQIGNYLPYILEILSNGKIWSTHAMAEELTEKHTELPAFKHQGLANAASKLANKGLIKKVASGTYRAATPKATMK